MVLPVSTHENPVNSSNSWVNHSELNQEIFNGLLSGFSIIANIVTQPFTVVCQRQQAGPAITGDSVAPIQTMNRAFRVSLNTIGVRGLFRGWLPLTVTGVPSGLIYIQTVEYTRENIQKRINRAFPNINPHVVDVIQAVASSTVANVLSLIPSVPGEVLASRVIVQPRNGLSDWAMAKVIYKEGGTSNFFRGFSASLYVGVVASAQWWMSYSGCRRELIKLDTFKDNAMALDMVAGSVAGCTSTLLAHPLDTVRVRIMSLKGAKAPPFHVALANIVEKEGTMALFRGLKASMYQSGIASIAFAVCYECIKRYSVVNTSDE